MACWAVRFRVCTFLRPTGKTGRAHYATTRAELIEIYDLLKKASTEAKPFTDMPPQGIYANNEMSLSDIKVIGFDYDYTLATYTPAVHELIFDLGKTSIVNNFKYPSEILNLQFDPKFAVRGIHFDTRKGLFMKIDSFHNIQIGTVYRGLQPVPEEEVKELYGGIHVPLDDLYNISKAGNMHQMVDLFAIPEISLISLTIQYLNRNNIEFDPEYVFYDIKNVIQGIHKSEMLHKRIMNDLDRYLFDGKETKVLLQRLRKEGKNLFVISNSGFPFINSGMKHMLGKDWLDLFDIVIVNARKPKFFHAGNRPFRSYDPEKETHSWERVTSLERGKVYQQGNLSQLKKMTGWFGPQVLYFGDHVYSDLADPSLRYGWRTGAIIPELEEEINVQNRLDYKSVVRWLVTLQQLIEDMQHQQCPDAKKIIDNWLAERDRLRMFAKSANNPYFGSLFRTYHNTSYFFQRLASFADIYMSSLTNILDYPCDYTFYPHRLVLPHEPSPHQVYQVQTK